MRKQIKWAISLTIVLAGVGVWLTLNASGFCYAEKRFLSSAEILDRVALENVNRDYYLSYLRNNSKDGQEIQSVIPYTSLAQFHDENPDCCLFYSFSEGEAGTYEARRHSYKAIYVLDIPVYKKLLGQAWASTLIDYRIKYALKSGEERSYLLGIMSWIDGCGWRVEVPLAYIVG